MEVIEAEASTVALRLSLRSDVTNHAGTIHGGAQYALGEATAVTLAAVMAAERIADLDLLTARDDHLSPPRTGHGASGHV